MAYLDNLRLFVRVFDLGALSAAARDQRVSPAVASNRIKELEAHLGARLFNRTTRKLSPTGAAQALYPAAVKVLEAVTEAEGAVAALSQAPRGALRLTAPLGLGRRVIAPAVPDFTALYPEISVNLRLSDHPLDIFDEGADVAFVLGTLKDSSLRMRGIMECERVLAAAPSYLAAHGVPDCAEALVRDRHRCLLLRFAGSDEFAWTLRTPEGLRKVPVWGPFDADDGAVLLEWCLAGEGIANRPRYEVAGALRDGALVEVLPDAPPTPATLAAVYPHRAYQDPKARLLIDFMAERLQRAIAAALA